jgi:hypothetical protein
MPSRRVFPSGKVLFVALTMLASFGLAVLASPQELTAAKTANVTVKYGARQTTIKLSGPGRSVTKVVAVVKGRSVEFKPLRAGATSVLSCSTEARKCASLFQRGAKKLTACACLKEDEKLSLSGGDKQASAGLFRFFGDLDSDAGGSGQHCWEDEELQMSICEP